MDISIAKRFLLLAQHPEKGRMLISGIHLQFGLAGALLLQMSMEDKLNLKDELVYIKKGAMFNDPQLLQIAEMIQSSRKPRKMKYWIQKIGHKASRWRYHYYDQMAKERLIKVEKKKFLGLIPYTQTYLLNSQVRNKLIQDLKSEIFRKKNIAPENMAVLGLVEACKMHNVLSKEKNQLKTLKKDLQQLVKESPISTNVDKTISEVQAAIISTIIATNVATTTAATAG
ncbi:GPP34 family phosphoprotein [Echinicola marina]|uniref:GOLPH3/VPS74 family protein n=1 Tax=Echinicola marina TaxID=2859768 RepID=UPI001CF635EE|nr:GPP34 family phosphoprotein [Echinicola marina]UCS94547.1 GPP34 family phosphoprotein [Echinicola marina]